MLGSPALDALDRIASRAQDARDAFRPGAIPRHDDVRTAGTLASADPLSVAAPPNAWFVTRDASGARAFTRDGDLTVADGVLRTRDGAEILGFPGGDARGAVPVPLRIPPTDRALGRGADARIEADGTITYTRASIEPRTGARTVERVTIGTVALARFPAGTAPVRVDATRAQAPPGVVPHVGTPADGTFPAVAVGRRDAGAIDIDLGLQRLDDAYLAFEAIAAAQKARAGVDKAALDLVK